MLHTPILKKIKKYYLSISKKSKIIHANPGHLNTYSGKLSRTSDLVCDLYKKENWNFWYTVNSIHPLLMPGTERFVIFVYVTYFYILGSDLACSYLDILSATMIYTEIYF